MTTFDLPEVRSFADDLNARMRQCDNGEGMVCESIDQSLKFCAELCCKYCVVVRQWGMAIFSGRAAFDPEVERLWYEMGVQLRAHVVPMLAVGKKAVDECYYLDGHRALESAIYQMDRLLRDWKRPALSIGASARLAHTIEGSPEVKDRIAAMEPLPSDWQPIDLRQQRILKRLRG